MPDAIPPELLAPCGMNCQVCYRHLTPRRACLGCRGGASNKPPHCRDCALKACAAERGVAFCAACSRFPCKSMAALEKTYQKRWGISLAETGRRAAAGEAEALLAGIMLDTKNFVRGDLPPRWSLLRVRAARGLGDMKLPDDPHTHVLAHLAGELVQQQVGRADGVVIAQQILVGGIAEQGGIVDKHAAP